MKFVLVLAFLAVASAIPSPKWSEFKRKFNKTYSTTVEEVERFKIYLNNVREIEAHNKRYENGLVKYKLGVNKFADLTFQEFKKKYNGYLGAKNGLGHKLSAVHLKDLPTSVDWRTKGIVAPIKDQGQCGSCWAFSAIASTESRDAQKTGKLVQLSEQQLVDCSGDYGDQGCNGGLMDFAFQYIIDNKGVDTETSYPYEARDDSCKSRKGVVGGSITRYFNITQGDEVALQRATAAGVVSVAIEASFSFQFYESGIFQDACGVPAQLDHGVAVVGYGTENGSDYWIVKNSWGADWGEKGYIRMSRGQNLCGVADAASYPLP